MAIKPYKPKNRHLPDCDDGANPHYGSVVELEELILFWLLSSSMLFFLGTMA